MAGPLSIVVDKCGCRSPGSGSWSEKGSPSRRREASQVRDLTMEQSGSRAAAIGQERAQGAPRPWTQRQDEEPEPQQPALGNGAKCAQGGCSKLHGARITARRAPPDQNQLDQGVQALCIKGHLPVFSHTTSREPRRHRPALFSTPAFPAIDAAGGSQRLPGFHRQPGTGERVLSRVPSAFEWLRRLRGRLAKTSAPAVLLARRLGQRWARFHFRFPCPPFPRRASAHAGCLPEAVKTPILLHQRHFPWRSESDISTLYGGVV
jgi:hypothetical protein